MKTYIITYVIINIITIGKKFQRNFKPIKYSSTTLILSATMETIFVIWGINLIM